MSDILKEFPKLYKQNTQGSMEVWRIYVAEEIFPIIVTSFGQMDGAMQSTADTIRKGKNIGRANETTATEQAIAEATSKYEKKLKAGYVDDLSKAQSGETDSIIEGGILPMLAHNYEEHGRKINFPCAIQSKLDGVRCIAIKNGQQVTLWTRTRKRITSCPHIEESLKFCTELENVIFDGELYNHEYKSDFSKIISAVRKDKPSEEAKKVQYHIYDLAQGGDFEARFSIVNNMITESEHIKIVHTDMCENLSEVEAAFSDFLADGYEGAMLRNWSSQYENKRSYGLQKYKVFKSSEFKIVGAEEGRGKLQGHLGAFVCVTSEGVKFNATMAVPQEQKKEMWENSKGYIGKWLEVKYQDLTDSSKTVPRFPVGMRIRDIEGGF